MQDLLDEKILRLKVQTALSIKNDELRKLHHRRPFSKEEITVAMLGYAERIRPFVADTSLVVNQALDAGQAVLAEGAQATLLGHRPRHLSVRHLVQPDRRRRLRRAGRRADPRSPRCWA